MATQKKASGDSFLVKTKGYEETFNSLDDARNQFDILKKRGIKSRQTFKVELLGKEGGETKTLEKVRIRETFYEEA